MKSKYALSTGTGNPRYLFKKTEFNQNQKTDTTYWINDVLIRSNPHSWIHESWILNLPIVLEFWRLYFQTARNNQNIKNNADTNSHGSFLDIYISRKIRLCVVDLEGKFQTNLQAKLLNFLVWKFRSIILNFLLFFAGFVKSSAFCNLSLLFQRVEIFELWFEAKMRLTCIDHLKMAATVCKKHWIWQLLQKIEEKWV